MLRALVTHPGAASIPAETAAIERRASSLVNSDEEGSIQIATAASSIGGGRAEQYLDGFAAGIDSKPEILRRLPPSLTFDLLKRRPLLLTSTELWQGSADHQLALAAFVASLDNTGRYGRRIIKAVLAASAWSSLTSLLTQFGYEGVRAVVDWIDALPQTPLSVPEPVLNAMAEQRYLITRTIQQKQIGARALRVVSTVLDPRADHVRGLGMNAWVGLVGSEVRLAPAKAELRSRAFILSIGLSGDGDAKLVREGFSAVYSAAYDELLDDEVWSFVEPYLPWYAITWDRCARLIRGVVRYFLIAIGPPPSFSPLSQPPTSSGVQWRK